MAGRIRALADQIVAQKSRGNPALAKLAKSKLVLKGIDPDRYDASSPDDPAVLAKLEALAQEMGLPVGA